MITIRLVPKPESQAALDKTFEYMMTALEMAPPILVEVGFDCAHELLREIFEGEGASPMIRSERWLPLTEKYKIHRARKHYPWPDFPILVNTGELRASLIDEMGRGHVIDRRETAYKSVGRIGTTDPIYEPHSTGYWSELPHAQGVWIPKRPMWVDEDTTEGLFIDYLEAKCVDNLESLL